MLATVAARAQQPALDQPLNPVAEQIREHIEQWHGAPYVNSVIARQLGRLGRSFGCPAVRNAIARPLIDALKDGQYVFSYYPDSRWLNASPYLKCNSAHALVANFNAP